MTLPQRKAIACSLGSFEAATLGWFLQGFSLFVYGYRNVGGRYLSEPLPALTQWMFAFERWLLYPVGQWVVFLMFSSAITYFVTRAQKPEDIGFILQISTGLLCALVIALVGTMIGAVFLPYISL